MLHILEILEAIVVQGEPGTQHPLQIRLDGWRSHESSTDKCSPSCIRGEVCLRSPKRLVLVLKQARLDWFDLERWRKREHTGNKRITCWTLRSVDTVEFSRSSVKQHALQATCA